MPDVEREIRDALDGWADAYRDRGADAYAALFSDGDDVVVFGTGADEVCFGRRAESIRSGARSLPDFSAGPTHPAWMTTSESSVRLFVSSIFSWFVPAGSA